MPIYEYRCRSCGHELEAIQKLSDPLLTFCPSCETNGLKKKISAAVFRLRGGGWYETDFKSDNKKNVAGDSDPKEKDSGKDKDNGKEKDKSQQQAKPEGGSDKSGKGGQGEKNTSAGSGSKPKASPPKAASSE